MQDCRRVSIRQVSRPRLQQQSSVGSGWLALLCLSVCLLSAVSQQSVSQASQPHSQKKASQQICTRHAFIKQCSNCSMLLPDACAAVRRPL